MSEAVGPKSPFFRTIVKPIYAGVKAGGSVGIDFLLGTRTTPDARNSEAALSRLVCRPFGWLQAARLFRRYPPGPDDVFVDIGSGAGRVAMLVGAAFRCRRVIGVEFDTEVDALARRNLRNLRPRLRTPIELVHADALTWELPAQANMFFFYNPFGGESFRDLAYRLIESVDRSPRRVLFLYANPREADQLAGLSRFALIDTVRSWRPDPNWARSGSVHIYELT